MDTHAILKNNWQILLDQYHANLQSVLTLQMTMIHDILPSVADELELGPDATEWARKWLHDTSSLFRISRRNDFTRSITMESIRKNLVWRLTNLWPLAAPTPIPIVHCLPGSIRDPFGRPILVIEVAAFTESADDMKPVIIQTIERLRVHLQPLNETTNTSPSGPALQFVVLLDLKGLSFRKLNPDVITWILREVIPRFPGMLAAVFMVNYNWAHSGMWSVIKPVLPTSALSRVFFPSQEELIQYFSPSALPKEYGGSLPSLTHLEDPLRTSELPSTTPSPDTIPNRSQSTCPSSPPTPAVSTITSISPTSLLNPFFGYPASSSRGATSLPHGRRRKRDLARTLAFLLWMRWRTHATAALCLAIIAFTIRLCMRQDHLRFPSIIATWKKAFLSISRRW